MTDTTELRAAFEKFWEAERQRTWDAADMPSHRGTSPSEAWSSGYKERTWIGFLAGHASATQQHEGLRKDAERLDWCSKNLIAVNQDLGEMFSVTYIAANGDTSRTGRFTTYRDAIDAALSVAGDNGEAA